MHAHETMLVRPLTRKITWSRCDGEVSVLMGDGLETFA